MDAITKTMQDTESDCSIFYCIFDYFPNRYFLTDQDRCNSSVESFHLSPFAIIIEVMHT